MKINMNEPFFLLKIIIHIGYRCIINVSSTDTNRKYYQWKIRDWHNSHSFSVQGRMVDTLMNISLSSHSINWFYNLTVPSVENAATHICKVEKGRYNIQSLTVSGYSFFREIQKASIDMSWNFDFKSCIWRNLNEFFFSLQVLDLMLYLYNVQQKFKMVF